MVILCNFKLLNRIYSIIIQNLAGNLVSLSCQCPLFTHTSNQLSFIFFFQLCRKCTDCGSRTPGSGQSSRWHANYTVCDSCYQQRNKGLACPICGRAYRHSAQKEMMQCGTCKRYVKFSYIYVYFSQEASTQLFKIVILK